MKRILKIISIFIIILTLSSCRIKEKTEPVPQINEPSISDEEVEIEEEALPQKAIDDFFENLLVSFPDNLEKLMGRHFSYLENTNPESLKAVFNNFFENFDYTIIGANINENNTAEVTVNISAPDSSELTNKLIKKIAIDTITNKFPSEINDIAAYIIEYIESDIDFADLKTKESTVKIYMIKNEDNDEWEIDFKNKNNKEALNAISGGLMTLIDQITQQK